VSNLNRAKIADLLDAFAEYVDEVEQTKLAAQQSECNTRIDALAERYSSSTGEEMPSALKTKLAHLDPDSLDQLLKVAKNNNESPDALGRPADVDDNPAPRTVKEAADQADQSFLNWLIND